MESIKAKIGDQFYETGVHQINGEWLRVTVIDAKNFITKPCEAPVKKRATKKRATKKAEVATEDGDA